MVLTLNVHVIGVGLVFSLASVGFTPRWAPGPVRAGPGIRHSWNSTAKIAHSYCSVPAVLLCCWRCGCACKVDLTPHTLSTLSYVHAVYT